MTKRYLIPFLLLISVSVSAQKTKIDSLHQILQRHPAQDTVRLRLMEEYIIALLYGGKADTTTIKLADENIAIAQHLNSTKGLVSAYMRKGAVYTMIGADNTLAINSYHKGIAILQTFHPGNEKDKLWKLKKETQLSANLGIIYFDQGDYKISLKYQMAAYQKQQAAKLPRESRICTNIGHSYVRLDSFAKAIEYYR